MKLQRYGCVDDGIRPREVVLLRSMACSWGQCTFCDYCEDNVPSVALATHENRKVLQQVTGKHGVLQVIDSASWTELPMRTIQDIIWICNHLHIRHVIFEGHWMFRDDIATTRKLFNMNDIRTEYIIGLETTSARRRLKLNKGMPDVPLYQIKSHGFNWANLMYGDTTSPKVDKFLQEVQDAADVFDYVNISIFTDNPVAAGNGLFREQEDVEAFYKWALPFIQKNLSNVFVFDYGDSRAPDTLGGVGNTI